MKDREIRAMAPLQSWDIFATYLIDSRKESQKREDIKALEQFKSTHNWVLDPTFVTSEDYTTIVITDTNQCIQWVNPGFKEMTGYTKKEAIGKHPKFLQGEQTSTVTKEEIRDKISKKESVSKQLLNYKKDGTTYLCDIKIIPLYNNNQEVTHFMALEKKAHVA